VIGLAAAAVLGACTIERSTVGSRLAADPNEWIINGRTTKVDVLRIFGPPDRIQRQLDGDVFIYSYVSTYSREFTIEEPASDIGMSYTSSDVKSDRLVVLFGKEGVVSAFGYRRGTLEMPRGIAGMTPFGGESPPEPRPAPGSVAEPAEGSAAPRPAATATAEPR
jgi:hypothetical protein